VFTRERTSLRLLGGTDVDADFVPDTTFAFGARDEAKAAAFMKAHGLQSG